MRACASPITRNKLVTIVLSVTPSSTPCGSGARRFQGRAQLPDRLLLSVAPLRNKLPVGTTLLLILYTPSVYPLLSALLSPHEQLL